MKKGWLCAFAAFACAIGPFAESSRPNELGWSSAHTWLFVVGVLEWKHTEMFGSFPQKERRDAEMVNFFKKAGVPAARIVFLRDKEATQQRIESAFQAVLEQIPQGDLLVLYYAGHGSRSDNGADTFLASYDAGDRDVAGWSVAHIPETIEHHTNVQRVLWLIDCCYSGQAADVVSRQRHGPQYACVTSSSASESSTGHWTFTEAFLDALRGTAYVDLNHDGRVTLAEFAAHAERDMTLGEEQISRFATAGNLDREMVLAKARPLANPRIGERVEVKAEGTWWPARIVEVNGAKFRVHFIGYGTNEDVTVAAPDMRPIKPKEYAVGSEVDVLWKKKWYPATVLQVKEGVHYIHYDGYGKEWDEWVSSKRVRVRKAG